MRLPVFRRAFPAIALLCIAAGCGSGSADIQTPDSAGAGPGSAPPPATAPAAAPAFENTTWTAAELGGTPVTATGNNAPHLVFDGERVAGADGCNRITGPYTRDGESLTFGMLAGTRMFCADAAEVEKGMREVTTRTRRWRMDGPVLELLDEAGTVIARFEAR